MVKIENLGGLSVFRSQFPKSRPSSSVTESRRTAENSGAPKPKTNLRNHVESENSLDGVGAEIAAFRKRLNALLGTQIALKARILEIPSEKIRADFERRLSLVQAEILNIQTEISLRLERIQGMTRQKIG